MKRKIKRGNKIDNAVDPRQETLELCRGLLSSDDFSLLLEELKEPLQSAIRINQLKSEPEALIERMVRSYGWKVRPVPYCPAGWFVDPGDFSISQAMEHRLGFYYIQDAASMLPVELFDFNSIEEPLILDMAASPGGKTTHLINNSMDRGLVIANDSSIDRITALRLVVQSWSSANTTVTHFPGEYFGSWFPNLFDRILLDAPCSMQNLRSTENHPMRAISPGERNRLAKRQESLLESGIQALKPEGQLVYSTCTLSPVEDEAVLDQIIHRFGDSIKVEGTSKHLPVPAPGVLSDGIKEYHPDVGNSVRLYPHLYHTSGFYAALITKLQPVETNTLPAPNRPFSRTRLMALNPKEIGLIIDFCLQTYQFNLDPVLEKGQLLPFRRDEAIFLLSGKWLDNFEDVPFQSLGLLLGEDYGGSLILSHEFITRFGMDFQCGYGILSGEDSTAWKRGEDIHTPFQGIYKNGDIIVVKDEQNRLLGRGKVLAGRLKNMLPRRLVY